MWTATGVAFKAYTIFSNFKMIFSYAFRVSMKEGSKLHLFVFADLKHTI